MLVTAWMLLSVLMYQSCHAAYIAEGYFVADHKALETYIKERTETNAQVKVQKAKEEMKKDIDYLLTEVNKFYKTFKPRGLDIQVKMRALDILSSDIFGHAAHGNVVHESDALTAFDSWLASHGSYNHLHYDFATLWTGYDLNGGTVGYAHTGRACKSEKATSVVEFNGIYQVAITTAHEIAHILGSSHDGAASEHIMAATGSPRDTDRWSFTVCSASDIVDYIATLTTNCLTTTSSLSTSPSTARVSYTGHITEPDVICQRKQKSLDSYICRASSLYGHTEPKGDAVCSYIYCSVPGHANRCSMTYSSDGLICAKGKRCENGKCVTDHTSQSQNVDENCLFGDYKTLELTSPSFKGTCSSYTSTYGIKTCYHSLIADRCCATCKSLSSEIAGCEYGDRSSDCKNHSPQSICHSKNNQVQCCDTCKAYIHRRSVLLDGLSQEVVMNTDNNTTIVPEEEVSTEDDVFVYDQDF